MDATEPMSMPSSRVEVHTAVVGRSFFWRRSSRLRRRSGARLPWWGKNSLGTKLRSQRAERAAASSSVRERLLVKRRWESPLSRR